jgi:ABC-2 type transport system permease protein
MSGAGWRVGAIARKEFLHILYDFRTLFILFLMPVVQLVMFGYALNMEIRQVELAVADQSNSPASRRLVARFRGSAFFRLLPGAGGAEELQTLFATGQARAALIIPADFERKLEREPETAVQVLVDASDANAATLIRNYCEQVLLEYDQGRGARPPIPFEMRPAILFNPDLRSSFFFVPGVMAMILVMISALLTSVAITREKESGTLEQLLVSPVRPWEIVLGKVLPYILLAFLDAALILGVALLLFAVPFRGSLPLLVGLTTLYVLTALSLGLLISTRARTQQVAMMAALTATLLPTVMLSGLIFPIASMPRALQYVSMLIPARYFLLIVRGVLLKGSGLEQLLAPTLALGAMTLVLLTVAIRRFSARLE